MSTDAHIFAGMPTDEMLTAALEYERAVRLGRLGDAGLDAELSDIAARMRNEVARRECLARRTERVGLGRADAA